MKFNAVVFDLDGTLLDTIEDLADSMNVALDKLGFEHVTIDQSKVFVGDGVHAFASRAMGGVSDAAQIDTCVELMRVHYAVGAMGFPDSPGCQRYLPAQAGPRRCARRGCEAGPDPG